MTAKKNFKKTNKNRKELSPKAKKVAMGTASVLLGATLMGSAKPVKKVISGKRDDEIGLVVKAATVEGTEENSDVVAIAGQEDHTTAAQTEENSTNTTNVEQSADRTAATTDQTTTEVNETTTTDGVSTEVPNEVQTETTNNASTDTSTVETNDSTVTTENAGNIQDTSDVPVVDETTQDVVEQTKINTTETSQEPELNEPPVEEKKEEKTTPTYDESKKEVEAINDKAVADLNEAIGKLEDKIKDLQGSEYKGDITIDKTGNVTLNTTVSGIQSNKEALETHIKEQIAKLDAAFEKYQQDLSNYKNYLDGYKEKLLAYETAKKAYLAELEKLGLWKEGDADPNEINISQELVLDKNENTQVKVDVLDTTNVWLGTETILNDLLDHQYFINGSVETDFIKLTYTGFKNSTYAGKNIDRIEVIYSNNVSKNPTQLSKIFFSDNLLDGFFYKNSKGMTMSMKFFGKDGKEITFEEDSAFVTVGSLNSKGDGNDYVEKAEIINGNGNYGQGVALPESSVTVHKGQNGDILFSDKNNEWLYKKSDWEKLTQAEKDAALNAWGQGVIDKYLDWDNSEDRSKEIFGAGLFKVWGNGITIRFSNELGSAWATFSTTIPQFCKFEGVHPGKPKLPPSVSVTVTPGQLELNKNSSVHIHYVDVYDTIQSGITSGFNHPDDGHGTELIDQKQSYEHLAIGDPYTNKLWDWEKAGYVLAEMHVPEVKEGTIKEDVLHHYVYLTHKIEDSVETITREKPVNQTIHYVYEDGSTAAPDHISTTLVFTQTGTKTVTKNLVTGEIINVKEDWNGEWTPTQTFVTVTSPVIPGYTADRPEVGPYDITVTNDNYGENLDKEDTVVYRTNSDTPDQPTQPTTPTQPTAPTTPNQPTDPQPTQSTPNIPEEEDFTRPLPEEEPGSEYPEQVEEEETGDKRVTPHASEIPNASSSGDASLATAGSDKQAAIGTETPETVSTDTTEVIEKTQNEETLPETGEHDKNEVATLLASLAAALGITGLAGTSKKRKKKDE